MKKRNTEITTRNDNSITPTSEKIPVTKLMQIQFLIEQGSSDAEIASQTGLALEDTELLIAQEGWRVKLANQDAQKSNEQRTRERWVRAISASSRYLSMKGMMLASNAAENEDTIGFANAARGAKTFVDLARQADGLDDPLAAAPQASLHVFFHDGVGVEKIDSISVKEMKRAEAT